MQFDDRGTVLSWNPPQHKGVAIADEIISIDLRITQYNVYITDTQSGQSMTNFTSDTTSINIPNNNMACSVVIEVSAVNPAGEGQRSTGIITNCKKRDTHSIWLTIVVIKHN